MYLSSTYTAISIYLEESWQCSNIYACLRFRACITSVGINIGTSVEKGISAVFENNERIESCSEKH